MWKPTFLSNKVNPVKSDSTALYFERMEPKILLSADALSGFVASDPFNETDENGALDIDQSSDLITSSYSTSSLDDVLNIDALSDVLGNSSLNESHASLEVLGALLNDVNDTVDNRHEIIFVDTATPDYQQLLDGLIQNSNTQYQVYLLQSDQDGIEQMSSVIATQGNVDAVHIVSHGNEDGLQLGNVWLSNSNLNNYNEQFQNWSDVLDQDADLLIYGCDLASHQSGQTLLNNLAELTQADISASDDLTGAAQLGGDWKLEYTIGEIESEIAFSVPTQITWTNVLGSIEVTTTNDVLDTDADFSSLANLFLNPGSDGEVSLREAIIAANTDIGTDTITLGNGTYTLTTDDLLTFDDNAVDGDLDITDTLIINGKPTETIVIDGVMLERPFEVHSTTLSMLNLSIVNGGNPLTSGNALSVSLGSTATLTNVTFSNNYGSSGGAIYNQGAVTLNQVDFVNNASVSSSGGGGAIFNEGGSVTATDTTFSENLAIESGGAIYNNGGSVILNRVDFTENGDDAADNYNTVNGGAIFNNAGTVDATDTNFTSNFAINLAGAVYNTSGTVDLNRVNFSGNYVSGEGTALGNGGAIANNAGSITGSEVIFESNHADEFGGAIANNGSVVLDRVLFFDNDVRKEYGGAIANDAGGIVNLVSATLSENTAQKGGGAISNSNSSNLNISSATFTGNTSKHPFGANGIEQDASSTVNIGNSILNDGDSNISGGIINSFGFNIDNDGTAIDKDAVQALSATGDQVGSSGAPLNTALDMLADNGGFSQTHALLNGSVAINASVTNTSAATTDQRGVTRSVAADIGAFETTSYLDQFNSTAFNGSDGSLNWSNDWQEIGESDGATNGRIIVGSEVGEQGLKLSNGILGVWREADLSSADVATLYFDWALILTEAMDDVAISVSSDGGSNWTLIDTLSGPLNHTSAQHASYDISAFISTNTQIKFETLNLDNDDVFFLDNVNIKLTNNANAPLVDGDLLVSMAGNATDNNSTLIASTDIAAFSNPDLSFELGDGTTGVTDGTFVTQYTLPENVRGFHFVSSPVTVDTMVGGVAGTYDLSAGQIVMTLEGNNIDVLNDAVSASTITVSNTDLLVYTVATGEYEILLQDAIFRSDGSTPANIHAVSIVESHTTVGVDTTLKAGTYIITSSDPSIHSNITTYTNAQGRQDLLLGADFISDPSKQVQGLEFIEKTRTVDGVTLDKGTLLVSIKDDSLTVGTVGGTQVVSDKVDIVALTINASQQDSAAAATNVDAQIFFDGSDINLSEEINGFSLAEGLSPIIPSVNNTPTVEVNIPDQILIEDFASYDIDLNAAFSDTETADGALGYSVTGNTNVNVSITNGIATITPTSNWSGNETLTFRATDSGGLFVEQAVLFTVNALNDAPTVETSIPDQILNEDFASYDIDLSTAFADVETSDANLTYTVNGANIGGSIVTILPIANLNGSETLTFRATDSGGLFVEQDVLFTINPVNDTPIVEMNIPNQVLIEDFSAYTIDLNAAFADIETPDAALMYSVTGNTNVNTSIANGIATITPTANWNGNETLTFRATDSGGLFVEQDVLFTVNSANDTPIVETNIPEQTLVEDFTSYDIDLNAAFTDVESTDAELVYSVTGNTNINVSITDGIATITPTANWNGNETLTFRATDSGSSFVEQDVQFTVSPINDAPTATNLTDDITYSLSGESVELNDIVITDLDNGEIVTATLTLLNVEAGELSVSNGASYDSKTGVWEITGSVTDVNQALSELRFIPHSGNITNTEVSVVIDDGDEDSSGALLGSLTININPEDLIMMEEVISEAGEAESKVEVVKEEIVEAVASDEVEQETNTEVVEDDVHVDGSVQENVESNVQVDAQEVDLSFTAGIGSESKKIINNEVNFEKVRKIDVQDNDITVERLREKMIAFNDPLALDKSGKSFIMKLDDLREEMLLENGNTEKVIGGSLTASAGFSVGYVVWLARSGVIMSSVLSSLPAWRFVDPLPVLGTLGQKGLDEDEETLESIVGEKNNNEQQD